jgi:dsDNA-binding SOS-regulon protein
MLIHEWLKSHVALREDEKAEEISAIISAKREKLQLVIHEQQLRK